ncbi:MAG: hypothetical protein PF495_09345 [Spirochaetales bacterium]|nr:hypothetical protein [Spirochaetales bacterium]
MSKNNLVHFAALMLSLCICSSCRQLTLNKSHEIKQGIRVDSSLYWNYNGETTLLLGAFNHGHNPFIDGSELDTSLVDDMDEIICQIREMVDAGGNTLRCVLDPGSAAYAGIEAYKRDGDGLYDLTQPAGPYWDRLQAFIAEAEKWDVIVELEIWDRFDWHGNNWLSSPFNPVNNANYNEKESGLDDSYQRHTIYRKHPMAKGVPGNPVYMSAPGSRKAQYDTVRHYQEIYIKKVLSCTFPFRNVIYNMNNETSEHYSWAEYWLRFVRAEAEQSDISVVCTNMLDDAFNVPDSKNVDYQLAHPEIYDYLDVSQVNSRLRDELHWDKIIWLSEQARSRGFLLHMTKLYGSDERLEGPWKGWKPGDTDNAIEEWWRSLIAGVAGVRFHRPTAGIGLCDISKACIRATRKVEEKVRFWDVMPRQDLLSERQEDEAYLAANPGEAYILYFTQKGGGSVVLNLEEVEGQDYELTWININSGDRGPDALVSGGGRVLIHRPDDSAHWVAIICRKDTDVSS